MRKGEQATVSIHGVGASSRGPESPLTLYEVELVNFTKVTINCRVVNMEKTKKLYQHL